jgi:hypothetical protein
MLWKGKQKFNHIEVAPGGASYGFGNYNTLGRTYFVNNITGSSANDGLTWDRAMDELSTAVTASEVYRQDRGSVTTNDYIRNTIVIQGTGTTYAAVSSLPSYTDVIGLGAYPFGDGTGIVVLGDATGAADGLAGSIRGTNFFNMQFVGAGSYYAADLAVAYRSGFEMCAFGGNASSAACAIAFNVVSASGLVLRDCKTIMHAAAPVIGWAMSTAGGNWNECIMENCHGYGSTTGYTNAGYLQNGSVVKNCVFYGGTTGLSDTSAQTGMGGLAMYVGNYASGGTTGMTVTNQGKRRCLDNWTCSNATIAQYEVT